MMMRWYEESICCYAMPSTRLCSIINGLSFLLAYLLHPWETHEDGLNEPREDFIGTRVGRAHLSQWNFSKAIAQTIYDLRFTIYDLHSSASGARGGAKQVLSGILKAVRGRD